MVTALLCSSWPHGQELVDPGFVPAVTEHIRWLNAGAQQTLDRPPNNARAAAALFTAADTILNATDLESTVARHLHTAWTGRPSRAPWAQVLARHQALCSDVLRQAAEPAVRSYRRRSGPHSTRAPARTAGYLPEHIPAFLEQSWYQKHLAPLEVDADTKSVRRLAAVLLVQQAAGGSAGDAADFLGINPAGGQFAITSRVYQWINSHGSAPFTTALQNLARDLDTATQPVDYQHRRETLRSWYLTPATWHEIITSLPPVPGPIRPNLDDRKRQEASAFLWAHVTGGEPQFAPRPIEAAQPDDIRRTWQLRRSNTWFQLSRPDQLNHYAALRELLLRHGEFLAEKIDSQAAR